MFKHPKNVCMTYYKHMKLSLNFSFILLKCSIFALIHAFLPDYFITSTTDYNRQIEELLKNSGCRKE